MKAARKICGEEPVRAVDSARALRDKSDPATLVFQCGAAPASSVGRRAGGCRRRTGEPVGRRAVRDRPRDARPDRARIARPVAERSAPTTYSQVSVTGFTDSVGSDDYNLALSKRRAESVAAYLKAHGLKTDSLTVTGRGKADPVASNTTPEGRASNRRVEIRLQH